MGPKCRHLERRVCSKHHYLVLFITFRDLFFSQIFELLTGGDYLFDPASGQRYSKDDDHIAQIMELMGEFPKSVAFAGRYSSDFFNRKGACLTHGHSYHVPHHFSPGELRHIQKLRFWPLESVLNDKYLLPKEEADLIASFLNPMLRLNPEKRAKAADLVHHAWLEGINVQGELDLIRRAEMEDLRRKGKAVEGSDPSGHLSAANAAFISRAKAAEQEIVDAMKPVDEDTSATEGESDSGPSHPPHTPAHHSIPKLGTPIPSSAGAKENIGAGKGKGVAGHHKPPPNGR